jgi:hypothetical protein
MLAPARDWTRQQSLTHTTGPPLIAKESCPAIIGLRVEATGPDGV